GGLANRTIGNADGNEQFAESGFSLRLFSNFIVNPEHMIGIQGYVAFSGLKPGADNVFDERLTVADLGGAIFKSFRLTRQLHATPLAGAHLSIQQLETGTEGFVALGARLEGSLSYVFG